MKSLYPLLALIALSAAPASATTYSVSTTGNDGGNGTTAPFRTFQRAVQALHNGDTIVFQPGVYTAGSWIYAQRVTLKGSGTGDVILDGAAATGTDGMNLYQSHGSVIQDLKVRNCRRVGIFVGESNGVTVRNCEITGNAGNGFLSGHSSDLLVENCTVSGNGSHGVYFSEGGDRLRLLGCRLANNQRAGVQINAHQEDSLTADPNFDGFSRDCRVERNVLWGNGAIGGAAIALMGVCDSLFANNLLYDNLAAGMTLWDDEAGPEYACKGNRIYFNTIVSTRSRGYHGVKLEAGSTGNELVNNLISWNSGPALDTAEPLLSNHNGFSGRSSVNGGSLAAWRAATGNDLNSFEGSPQLDASYHPLPGSPARDTGVALPNLEQDLASRLRPEGPNPDLGCFEEPYGGTVTPPTPPTPPAAPTGLTATAGNSRVDLRWNDGGVGVTSYGILRSDSQNGTYTRLTTTPVPNLVYTDLSLTNGTTYWYRIAAINSLGTQGQPSTPVSATPAAPVVQTFTVSGRVTLNGAGLSGVLMAGGGQSALTAADGSYTLSSLIAGTYSVTASRTGYTFSPAQSVTVGPSRTGINWTATVVPAPAPDEAIYKDALRTGWKASVGKAKYSLTATSPVAEGSRAISLTITGRDGFLRLTGTAIPVTGRRLLRFAVHGGTAGGQDLRIRVLANGTYQHSVALSAYGGAPKANGWTEYAIPLLDLSANTGSITALKIDAGAAVKELFVDNVRVE